MKAGRAVLNELLEALAEAISLESQSFSRYFDPEMSEINIRINYYPSCPRPDLTLGLVQHSDASVLTLVNQFGSSNGLQVFKNGEWMTVPWPCNKLLVNLGDFIEIMSNGRLKSSWHRAVPQLDTDRASVALFYNPPAKVEIGPVEDGEPIKYKKIVLEEYFNQFYKSSPTPNKGFVRNLLIE